MEAGDSSGLLYDKIIRRFDVINNNQFPQVADEMATFVVANFI